MSIKLLKLEKQMCPSCDTLQTNLDDRGVAVDHVDIYADPEIAIKYGAMSVPVLIALDENDNEIDRFFGYTVTDGTALDAFLEAIGK
jgi:glutaredoxin